MATGARPAGNGPPAMPPYISRKSMEDKFLNKIKILAGCLGRRTNLDADERAFTILGVLGEEPV